MGTDFVLIYPPTYTRELELPEGGLFLAQALLASGYSVVIINEYTKEEIIRLINQYSSDKTIAFGISVVSGRVIDDAIELAQYLRKHFSGEPIIWGGPHVTALPKQTLESLLVDFIAWGEAEGSLPQLLDAIKQGWGWHDIKGIGFKEGAEIKINRDAGFTDLDGVLQLPYDILNMTKYYRRLNIGGEHWLGGLYSRGCPFRCSFCINSNEEWSNSRMRFHSADHIINDVSRLVNNYGADGITILDDHFFIKEKRIVSICEALLQNNLRVKFRAAGRVDSLAGLHEDTYRLLKETGFIAIGAGIESGSPRMLEYINKNITLDQVYKVDELLSKFGFFKHWNFMTALPGEEADDIRMTLSLIADLAETSTDSPFPFSSYKKYIPLPGTKLFKIAVSEYGLKEPQSLEDWGSFSMKYELRGSDGYDSKVRPWLTSDLAQYTNTAEELVRELNSQYTGSFADTKVIKEKIGNIRRFIRSA